MMNDFTKEELNDLLYCINISCKQNVIVPSEKDIDYLYDKLISMIDNYPEFNVKGIAESHLNEAASLISHAMCLLGMNDE